MQVIRDFVNMIPYRSRVYDEYFGGLKVGVMDIETSGLYPNSSKIILGGLLIPGNEGAEVVQYFSEDGKSEEDLLMQYGETLSTFDVLITYNGAGFDLPFLKHRFLRKKLPIDLDLLQSFDLYRALHRYSKMREILPNLKQKSIETFLGLSPLRKDEISGGESVALYEEYLKSGSRAAREKILLHNRDDLVQLASILKILDKLDLHKILFHEGFTVTSQARRIAVKNTDISRNLLTVTGKTRNASLDYYSFETGYQAVHKAAERTLSLTIPLEKRQGAYFIDLESIDADFSQLEPYPSYTSGYLILRENGDTNYAEINMTVKVILKKILADMV